MMRLLSLTMVFLLFTNSCRKKVDCPAFHNPELEQWVPYAANEIIHFKNGSRNADLKIKTVHKTPAQKGHADGGFSGVVCRRSFTLTGELRIDGISSPYEVFINLELTGLNNSDAYGSISINGGLDYTQVSAQSGFSNSRQSQVEMDNIGYFSVTASATIGGIHYDRLQSLVFKMPYRTFDHIYVARTKGIVGFRLKEDAADFVIQ